jgi:hypothetical protein
MNYLPALTFLMRAERDHQLSKTRWAGSQTLSRPMRSFGTLKSRPARLVRANLPEIA